MIRWPHGNGSSPIHNPRREPRGSFREKVLRGYLRSDDVREPLVAHCHTGVSSEVVRRETGTLRDAPQHAGADLLAVVKGEHKVCPALSLERSM
jgi:hypothetical protein